jgi:ABC-type polysaccharide/polyol phosphate export permease
VVPAPPATGVGQDKPKHKSKYIRWSELLRRVFDHPINCSSHRASSRFGPGHPPVPPAVWAGARVPYFYFPASELGAQLVDFLVSFVTLLVLLLLFHGSLHRQMLILPLSVLLWLLIAAGAGLCLSVIFVFFRDIRPIVQMGLMLALFSSTVFFKPETLSGQAGELWLTLNPVCYWAALFQKPIYYAAWPLPIDWEVSLASAVGFILLGIALYRSLRHKFYFYF